MNVFQYEQQCHTKALTISKLIEEKFPGAGYWVTTYVVTFHGFVKVLLHKSTVAVELELVQIFSLLANCCTRKK